jgi:transcriptional regulator with XRE-family HTH domain
MMENSKQSWRDLHVWQLKYRKQHNLTATQFLRALNLSPTSTYIQYLSKDNYHTPSLRQGSAGRCLTDALQKAMSLPTIYCVERTILEEFSDFLLDHEEDLLRKGLLSFSLDNINEKTIDISVYVASCWITPEFITETLSGIKLGLINIEYL